MKKQPSLEIKENRAVNKGNALFSTEKKKIESNAQMHIQASTLCSHASFTFSFSVPSSRCVEGLCQCVIGETEGEELITFKGICE